MKHQLQTIREALELATDGPIVDRDGLMREALTALSELERMAGEPVAWKHDCAALLANDVELWIDNCPHCGRPRATPPAQQPHDRVAVTWDKDRTRILAVTLQDADGRVLCVIDEAPAQQQYEAGDMASAHNDGFRAGVASVAQQPHEIEVQCPVCNHKFYEWPNDQQPQAEPFGYVSQHTNGSWEFSPTAAGVYPDTAKSITAVYTKQPQAEVVSQLTRDFPAVQQSRAVVERQTERYRELMGDDVKNTLKQPQAVPVLAESELRSILQGTNHMVKNAMHGAFWPELEEACRAVEQAVRAKMGVAVPMLTDDEIKAEIRSRGQMVNGVKGDGFMQGARWAEQAVRAKMEVAVPMTLEQIVHTTDEIPLGNGCFIKVARAVEKFHGIVGKEGA